GKEFMAFTDHSKRLAAPVQARLAPLYERAASEAGLTATDFYSVRDLLELSGLEEVESLHALLLALFVALNEGSPCLAASQTALVSQLTDLAGDQAETWAEHILADLADEKYAELVGRDVKEQKPLVLFENGGERFVYFQKYLKHEQASWDLLQQ